VIYKIIVKSLANRVKHHLSNYICHSQYAFIAQRHMSSNIIITREIIHFFNLMLSSLKLILLNLLIDLSGVSF
jgi:hypothetical protein